MKKGLMGLIVGIVFLTSCEDFLNTSVGLDDLGVGELDLMSQYFEDQNLVITSFILGGEDLTNNYSDYEFIFAQDGSITAINATDTLVGSWNMALLGETPKVAIDFGDVPTPMDELNEDWLLVSQEEDIIDLKDGDDAEEAVDYLTFMRVE